VEDEFKSITSGDLSTFAPNWDNHQKAIISYAEKTVKSEQALAIVRQAKEAESNLGWFVIFFQLLDSHFFLIFRFYIMLRYNICQLSHIGASIASSPQ